MTGTTDHAAAIHRLVAMLDLGSSTKTNKRLRMILEATDALAAELAAAHVESERRKRHATNFAKEAQRAKDELAAERARVRRLQILWFAEVEARCHQTYDATRQEIMMPTNLATAMIVAMRDCQQHGDLPEEGGDIDECPCGNQENCDYDDCRGIVAGFEFAGPRASENVEESEGE